MWDNVKYTKFCIWWGALAWPKLSSILAEIVHPLHYRGWQTIRHLPRVLKLNLTNFQAELNKQSKSLLLMCPFPFQSLQIAFITQIAVLRWDCDVKPYCKNDTHVACLAETQLPRALLMSESADEREKCWHVVKFLSLQWLAQVISFSFVVHNL